MSFKIAILALLLVSVFSIHITSQQAHREEADFLGLSEEEIKAEAANVLEEIKGLSEEEAEARAFEEIMKILGYPDELTQIA
jgi:hypothetical protein